MTRALPAALLLAAAACAPAPGPLRSPADLSLPAAPGSLAPWLAVGADGSLQASWLEPAGDGAHALRWSRRSGGGWEAPLTLLERRDVLANWADPPSFLPTPTGLLATWPQRDSRDPHAYHVRLAELENGRVRLLESRPHRDDTATEHGFAQVLPAPGGGLGVAWLDGRDHALREPPDAAMALRFAPLGPGGEPGASVVLDARTCDCCPLATAETGGAVLVAYRDRSDGGEVRDVSIVRGERSGWSPPARVHEDGWEIHGCPVNGPALAAGGDSVLVAWFTGAGEVAAVKAAWSRDGGLSFGEPLRLDEGAPAGRVAAALLDGGDGAVAWLEADELRLRRVGRDGRLGPVRRVAAVAPGRGGGMPRLVAWDGALAAAWTDDGEPARVRVSRVPEPPG